jgi:hypothetical protein
LSTKSYPERGVTASCTELAEGCPQENMPLHVITNGGKVRGRQRDLVSPCISLLRLQYVHFHKEYGHTFFPCAEINFVLKKRTGETVIFILILIVVSVMLLCLI